jgi:hypothetical protein
MCIVPKLSLIDSWFWFHLFLNYLYLVAILNLKVSYAFIFCYSMKDKLKTICYVFPYDLNKHLTFIVSFSWSFVCVLLHVITWLLSFFYQDYVFQAHVLSSFDPSTQCLHRWSRLCRCMSPQKLFFVITYRYISNVSIIFDAPCLFLHHLPNVLLHFVALLCIFWN